MQPASQPASYRAATQGLQPPAGNTTQCKQYNPPAFPTCTTVISIEPLGSTCNRCPVLLQIETPIPILGLVAFEFWAMHFVEIKRWQDFRKPGSVDRDPLFPANALPAHEVGYPGGIFAPFVPGNLEELKVRAGKPSGFFSVTAASCSG